MGLLWNCGKVEWIMEGKGREVVSDEDRTMEKYH